MAVDDRASAKPSTAAEVGGSPRIKAKAPRAAAEPKTCRAPSPKTSRPMIAKRCQDSSRPIMNSRKTTPNSATGAICSTFSRANGASQPICRASAPRPKGPSKTPAPRKPRTGLNFKRRNSGTTTPAVARKINVSLYCSGAKAVMGLFSQNNSRREEILGFSRSRGAVKNLDTLAGGSRSLSRAAGIRHGGAMSDPPNSNAPELSVSELSAALKRTVEDRFGFVRVRGEISNYRGPHTSGHAYFCLKDQSARIDAVIWKGSFAKLKTKPQEGLEVVATGKVTTYPGKSTYQIIVESLEPAGVGALMALVEARRRKLAAEGLFDEARKRPLPFLPACIGVVTSPTGAVIRDILHRIAERFPRHVVVWPVRVQGETSAAEIAPALDGLNALPEHGHLRRPDVIIVARGGGSLEDLWSFNEEIVVRAAARSLVPLIAAVGHETDWTLIDHAADLRAPTPTAAAEKAVPVRSELAAALADLGRRHIDAALRC